MKLSGRVALVAGGGQGIGEGIVRCLAEEGADVAVCDINIENATRVASDAEEMGRKSLAVPADLLDRDSARRVIQETLDSFGRIDILVNNVGGQSEETMRTVREDYLALGDATLPQFMAYKPDTWDRFYELNLKTHVTLTHAVTPHFIRHRSGSIVNVSSVAGRQPDPTLMPYAAAKAADISFTWSLARALAPYNVRVNCICPGLVYTPLWERGATSMLESLRIAVSGGQELPPQWQFLRPETLDNLSPREFWLNFFVKPSTPLGVEQTPEDMGRAVVFLVSDDAKNITGQVLHIDGGQVMR